jgi:hypothetical protein
MTSVEEEGEAMTQIEDAFRAGWRAVFACMHNESSRGDVESALSEWRTRKDESCGSCDGSAGSPATPGTTQSSASGPTSGSVRDTASLAATKTSSNNETSRERSAHLFYAESEVFSEEDIALLKKVVRWVAKVPGKINSRWIRCHELAIAIGEMLQLPVVDGKYLSMEHSWIPLGERRLLDVYAPGRLPQVQLVDTSLPSFVSDYVVGPPRTDINRGLVEQLKSYMTTELHWCPITGDAVDNSQSWHCPDCERRYNKVTRWRVGRKLGRTLYRDEICIGMADTRELAAEIVSTMNKAV